MFFIAEFVTLSMQKLKRRAKRFFYASVALMAVIFLVINGCVSRYVWSDGEIKAHYAKKNFIPCFSTAAYKDKAVYYAQTGSDTMPMLLFIHGGPGAWYSWIEYLDDDTLRRNYNMIAVDRLGYGKSEYGKAEISTTEQVNAIKKVLEHFPSNKKITIVGKSYGTPIAGMLAKDLGEKVDRLILISPVVTPDKEKFYWFSPLGKSKAINWMLPDFLNVATTEKYAHAAEMKKILPEWKKVSCPAVVMTGAKDWVADTCNFRTADTLLQNCCNKKMIWLPDAGHFIAKEKKDLVKNVLLGNEASACY